MKFNDENYVWIALSNAVFKVNIDLSWWYVHVEYNSRLHCQQITFK